MFIFVAYKDAPELSHFLRRNSTDVDPAVEKTLLVNPNCHVRVMLEYIRKKCKLALSTQFDLAEASGALKGLFNMPTFAYATDQFVHKNTYYLIVMKPEADRRISVLPQLNRENTLHADLEERVKRFLLTGAVSTSTMTPLKTTPPSGIKPVKKK